MSDGQITCLTDVSLLTCVVATGRSNAVIRAARELGTPAALVHHARGIGPRERLGLLGIAIEVEKDVVSMLVANEYREIVFDAVYRAAGLDVPGAGFVYLTPVEKVATYVPREVLARATQRGEGEA